MKILNKVNYPSLKIPENYNVVVLDTEVIQVCVLTISYLIQRSKGLGSFTKTEDYDTKLFSLTILLSSVLIYNSTGTIDDNAMENISYPSSV
jgi:hypothetical protein